ncbi:hypothetical protein [Rhodococcus erythropolis]|uniref:Transposase n=1 Tax=Rhodococcus erythropolis TaxID=1833 RepID=A0AAX3ZYN3_RHOER|nr:hypothetical protein [Rhodococcus erythropolis]WMN01898.1 hypothetical protein QIE55_31860 [Rhodococcus erythropolis]WMN03184.1 hypothetical protein QIE55_32805 [Rhodococcus erythropolis]
MHGSAIEGELELWARGIGVNRARVDHVLDLVELPDIDALDAPNSRQDKRQRLRIAIALLTGFRASAAVVSLAGVSAATYTAVSAIVRTT